MFLLEVLFGGGDDGGYVVRVWVWSEHWCIGAAFWGDTSSQFRIQELYVNGLLSADMVVL